MMPALRLLLALLAACGASAAPQNTLQTGIGTASNAANEFFIGFMRNEDNSAEPAIFVTTDEPGPVNFTVQATNPAISTSQVARYGAVTRVQLDQAAKVEMPSQRNNGIHIKAEEGKRIIVYGLNDGLDTSDAFTALPCIDYPVRGRLRYFIFSASRTPTDSRVTSLFLIVTCRNNTSIIIRPSQTVTIPDDLRPSRTQASPGQTSRFVMDSMQTLLVESINDLTGTVITSDKPIAVFTGHRCARIPPGTSACDHLVEQVPPSLVWGTLFFFAGLAGRSSGEIYRVASTTEDSTTVNISCIAEGSSLAPENVTTLQLGRETFAEFEAGSNDYCCVESSEPVFLMQYSKGGGVDRQPGDPFMVTIPPVHQYANNFTVTARLNEVFTNNHVNMFVSVDFFESPQIARDRVRINGTRASDTWQPIYCSGRLEVCGYGTRVSLRNEIAILYHENPNAGIGATVYGFASFASYGYPVGYHLDPIAVPIISLSPLEFVLGEEDGNVTITVTRQGDISDTTVVELTTTSLEATAGEDFVDATQQLEFLPGERVKEITIAIVDEFQVESSEIFQVSLSESQDRVALLQTQANITILDNDLLEVGFERASYTESEVTGRVVLVIRLNVPNPSPDPIILLLNTEPGTATSGVDYLPLTDHQVVLGQGEQSQTVVVDILDDNMVETRTEVFTARLDIERAPAGLILSIDKAFINILDFNTVQLQLEPSSVSVEEDSGNITLTVVKSGRSEGTTTVELSTMDGSAEAGEDYESLSLLLTFLPNEVEINVTLTIFADSALESDESFSASLAIPEGERGITILQPSTNIRILNDDEVVVRLEQDSYTVEEGGGSVTVTVVKEGTNNRLFSVQLGTSPLSARDVEDFTPTVQELVFAPEDTNHSVVIPISSDNTVESAERFSVDLSVPLGEVGVTISDPRLATVTILDDDTVEVRFDPLEYVVVEGVGGVEVRVVKEGETSVDVSVDISTEDGTAMAPNDFIAVREILTISSTETARNLTVLIPDDTLSEENKTFSLHLLRIRQRVIVPPEGARASVTIVDDDVVRVSFLPSSYTVGESEGSVTLTAVKTGNTSVPITVEFFTEPGSAQAGVDFTPAGPTVIIFGEDETTLPVVIRISDDTVLEAVEGFSVRLRVPGGGGGVELGDSVAAVWIEDDDSVSVQFDPQELNVEEEVGILGLRLVLEGDSDVNVSVLFSTVDGEATSPSDYNATTMIVTFDPTESEKFVGVGIRDDAVHEAVERLQGSLTALSSGVVIEGGPATISIADNDMVPFGFEIVNVSVAEDDGVAIVTVVKLGENEIPVVVNVSTEDGTATAASGDYVPLFELVQFSSSDSRHSLNVTLLEDGVLENTEEFFVRVGGGEGVAVVMGRERVTVSIEDSSGLVAGFVLSEVSAVEGSGFAEFRILLSSPLERPVNFSFTTLDGNATAGEDYLTTVVTVILSSGEFVGVVRVPLVNDSVYEGAETFLARLSTAEDDITITENVAMATIIDDDRVLVTFDPQEYVVDEGEGSVEVRVEVEGERTLNISVTFTTQDESAFGSIFLQDYVPVVETLVFAPNETERNITIMILDNTAVENEERFLALLAIPPGETGVTLEHDTATITITDEDVVFIGFEEEEYFEVESEPTVFLTLFKIGENQVRVSVEFSTVDGTARAGEDYELMEEVVRFDVADTSALVRVRIFDDGLVEGREEFLGQLRILADQPRVVLMNATAAVVIRDDDVVEVQFAQMEYEVAEGEGNVTLIVVREAGEAVVPVSIFVSLQEDSAEADLDFPNVTLEVSLSPNVTRTPLTLLITNDDILEGMEEFTVVIVGGEGVRVREGGGEASVRIVDDDVVEVGGEDVRVGEENGTVLVCLSLSGETSQPIRLELEFTSRQDGLVAAAEAGVDFNDTQQSVTFEPGQMQACVAVVIIPDNLLEGEEEFCANIVNTDPVVRLANADSSCDIAIIIADAGLPPPAVCQVEDPILITPFQNRIGTDQNFNFHGTCEHILVTMCDTNPGDFAITVDFLASDLEMGRVGVRLGDRRIVITESLSLQLTNLGDPISQDGTTIEYADNIFISQDGDQVTVLLENLDVRITRVRAGENSLVVNIFRGGALSEVCGLCGTLEGVLLHSDRSTVADIVSRTAVEVFADSWRVAPGEQFLREERRECGFLSNDSIVGDPLFTVPLYDVEEGTPGVGVVPPSLCFEIHGATNQVFNLVSDRCTTVSALYTAMDVPENGNIVGAIGVRAVNRFGQCVNIRVDLEGNCTPVIMDGNETVVTSRYRSGGILVSKHRERARISVPNCENVQLVMWAVCEEVRGQRMVEFVISRGVNLRPTSHGLLGQFWNIPITFERYNYTGSNPRVIDSFSLDQLYVIAVDPPEGPTRRFVGELFHRTWDRSRAPCYYAGSSQGGPLREFEDPRDAVIEGRYHQYRVSGLFESQFAFSRFDSSLCE